MCRAFGVHFFDPPCIVLTTFGTDTRTHEQARNIMSLSTLRVERRHNLNARTHAAKI